MRRLAFLATAFSAVALSATGPPVSDAQFEKQAMNVPPAVLCESAIEVKSEIVGKELVIYNDGDAISMHEIALSLERSAVEADLAGLLLSTEVDSSELTSSVLINRQNVYSRAPVAVKGGVPSAGAKLAV